MGKVIKIVLLTLGVVIAGAAVFVATYKPKMAAASAEVVERTPERVARGKYLVDAVLGCMDCHSQRDMTRFGAPITDPQGGGGNTCWGAEFGMPGKVCLPNISPDQETGIGAWSDGEIIRAIREGIDRDGKGLFPMMPYTQYRSLPDDDVRAVVAYLRSLPPVKRAVEQTEVKFPVSFFVKMAPKPVDGPVATVDKKDRVAYGKHLAKVSGCQFCHTPIDKQHRPLPGMDFAGGHEFKVPWGALRSSNLTPHETGMGQRDEKAFVGMFKAFAMPAAELPKIPIEQATLMPWLSRAQMTEEDLGAIHAFLRTVPAVNQAVEKRTLPQLAAPAPAAAAPAAPTPDKPVAQ